MVVSSDTWWFSLGPTGPHLGLRELGHRLGALGHGVLGELTREDEADGGLHLAGRERGLLVVAGELAGLGRDALEDVVDERVHDAHALLGHAGVRVHLLQHLVDVAGVGVTGLAAPLVATLLAALGAFAGRSLGHVESWGLGLGGVWEFVESLVVRI